MDSTIVNDTFFENGWTIFLVSFLILVALYFVQKYAYLIDRKLNQLNGNISNWEGKPWPLVLSLILGVFTLLFNVFSPNDMQWSPANWYWAEWVLLLGFSAGLVILAVESIQHFAWKIGVVRIIIFTCLMWGFFYAGLLAGLLIAAVLALVILIYFFRNWRKIMVIK